MHLLMGMAQIISSKRGGKILVHRNYLYHFHSSNKQRTRTYWRCEKRDICNARATTNFVHEDQITVHKVGGHSHVAEHWEPAVRAIQNNIRRRAEEEPNAAPAAILDFELENISDDEIVINLPERMALIRNINRQQNERRPNLPRNLGDIEIIPPYNRTINGGNFLQADTGRDDENRTLIFYDRRGLENLARSQAIFCDGTFKTVPNQFYQLYTLHGSVLGHVFPLVYSLTTRKRKKENNDEKNVYDLVINRVQRTNNYVEGWHNRFQRSIDTHHAAPCHSNNASRKWA